MSAITLQAVRRSQYWITYSPTEITWEGLMQHSPHEIKEKLLKALDKDNNVVDMGTVMEVIGVLEKMQITKEALERTRLGKYINELRKKTNNELLARRAKNLVRSWQKLIVPTDHNSMNGEKMVHATAALAPESGLNFFGSHKIGSPATINHKIHHYHHHRNRSNSPIGMTSPIDSYCSSTSTSPALAIGYQGSRPSTPSVFLPKTNKIIASPEKENPTTTTAATTTTTTSVTAKIACSIRQLSPELKVNNVNENLSRYRGSTTTNLENENNFSKPTKHKNAKSVALPLPQTSTNDKVICSRHSLNVDVVAKTNAANKRLRKDSSNSKLNEGPNKKMCNENNNVMKITNGVVECGDSSDSTRSLQEELVENETKVPSELMTTTTTTTATTTTTLKKMANSKLMIKKEASDSLKEKLATHTRANKVKTTAQLIQELKAKNTSTLNVGSLLTLGNNDLEKASSSRASPVYPRRNVNNVLDGDHDMNKTKTEMMEKFLLSSVGSDSVDGFDNNSRSCELNNKVDPVDLILARLPPINADEINWDEDDQVEKEKDEDKDGGGEDEKVVVEVSDEVLNRLHNEPWQCVNGNYDHEHEFREWHQALSLRSCNNELLHILPYVNID